jgi:SAM-dependent methyltransferase
MDWHSITWLAPPFTRWRPRGHGTNCQAVESPSSSPAEGIRLWEFELSGGTSGSVDEGSQWLPGEAASRGNDGQTMQQQPAPRRGNPRADADAPSDSSRDDFFSGLRPPPGAERVPDFERGWASGTPERRTHLTYVDFTASSWSDDLEELHEESSRDHFMDVLTRNSLMAAVASSVPESGVVADLGCSTGYLLVDLARAHPRVQLVGVDVVAAGLRKAHVETPAAALLLADVCDLPIGDQTINALVSANMLEHVADDVKALTEIHRILVPGGMAGLVVPFGQKLYDYYDRFLGHERRYAASELSNKAQKAGLEVVRVDHLGQLLYPAFWLVKKRNRMLRDKLRDDGLRVQVENDIAATVNSRIGAMACRLERRLTACGIRFPFGIRELVVVRKPAGRG